MAAALLRHALDAEDAPLKSIDVQSAGISAYDNDEASPNAIRAMKKVGIDLTSHRSQSVTDEKVRDAFAIVGMTQNHVNLVQAVFDPPTHRLIRFRDCMENASDVPDPFGGPLEEYEACRDSIVEAIPPLIDYLRRELTASAPEA